MELFGQETARNGQPEEWVAPAGTETGLEDSMQGLSLWGREAYPERPGVPDCAFYIRTGVCGYGAKCRYNHPRDRGLVGGAVRSGVGKYPERVGELACQYYLRTGTCKFGASCKFHHPRNAGGSLGVVPVNVCGYPLRPGEKECSYYLKTGQCKFGITCKFHHPQPAGTPLAAAARPFYPNVQTLSVPSAEQHGGPSTSYRVVRPPALPGSYVPSAYGPMLYHPGVVPFMNWNTYSGTVSPLSPGAQPSAGPASPYGMSQLATSASALSGTYPSLLSYSGPTSSLQKEIHFPERPGQPECQYYMKTGVCKFGPSCRYHHPVEVLASKMNCALSPLGLPLRPGVQPCAFYMEKGRCKFGRLCKFDHPIGNMKYSPSASLIDMPVASYMFNSSGATSLPTNSILDRQANLSSDSSANPRMTNLQSSGNNFSSSVGLVFAQTHPVSHFSSILLPNQSSPSVGRSRRQDGKLRR